MKVILPANITLNILETDVARDFEQKVTAKASFSLLPFNSTGGGALVEAEGIIKMPCNMWD